MGHVCGLLGKPAQFVEGNFLPSQSLPRLALRLCCKTDSDFSARHVIGMNEVPDLTNIFSLAFLLFSTNIWAVVF